MNVSIILAAGEGTRMKSNIPKVLHRICGRPILEYVVRASKKAGIKKNYIIIGHGGEKIKESFKDYDLIFKTQPIGKDHPYGTGFAVMQAIDYIEDGSNVLILYGDTPLISDKTIETLIDHHKGGDFDGTVLTAYLEESTGYGRIIRGPRGQIQGIVEEKDASREELDIKEINTGIYCFKASSLKYALGKIDNQNAQGEYYVTDVIRVLKDKGYRVGTYLIGDSREIHGINSRVQLAFCENVMRGRINIGHMENGVTIIDPKASYIGADVSIGRDSIIYPGAILEGDTSIGESCIIGESCRISNSRIGEAVEIYSSTIEDSSLGNECKIGPYAHLRPNCSLGKNIKIGNFVEVKNSSLGDHSKAGHLAYIGDADVGKNVNIGCGVVFVNYDGRSKSRTIIKDNAFIGSNSNLVAPLLVEEWAYVAAGSTITRGVKEGNLSIARSKQRDIQGWVDRMGYREKK